MSICWGPKVHQTRFWEPSSRSTVSTGASALRVRISASCFFVGLPVAWTLCRMHRVGAARQLPGVSQQASANWWHKDQPTAVKPHSMGTLLLGHLPYCSGMLQWLHDSMGGQGCHAIWCLQLAPCGIPERQKLGIHVRHDTAVSWHSPSPNSSVASRKCAESAWTSAPASRSEAGLRTVGPEPVPVDEHVSKLALVAMLQVVLELCGGWADVVDHELHRDIVVLRKVCHILPGAFRRVHLLQQLDALGVNMGQMLQTWVGTTGQRRCMGGWVLVLLLAFCLLFGARPDPASGPRHG